MFDALSPNHAVEDPSDLELLEDISTVHNRDFGLSSADPSTAPKMRLRTTAVPRLEESALLSRVTVHLHLPHQLPVLLRPVHHLVLRRRLVRRVLVLLQLVLHRGIVLRVGEVHLEVCVTPAVVICVVHLREEGSRRVVDVVQ